MPFKMLKLKGINLHLEVLRLTVNGIKNTVLHFRPIRPFPFQRLWKNEEKKKKKNVKIMKGLLNCPNTFSEVRAALRSRRKNWKLVGWRDLEHFWEWWAKESMREKYQACWEVVRARLQLVGRNIEKARSAWLSFLQHR